MMVRVSAFIAGLVSCISLVVAQGGTIDPNNRWIYPPPGGQTINQNATIYSANINITYGVQQRQSFQWTTNYTEGLTAYLWQEGPPDSVQNVELVACGSAASTGGEFYWDGNIGDIDLNNGTIAFLLTYRCDPNNAGPFFYSHYFNLTARVTTTSTTATATPTSMTSTSPTTTATTTPTPSASGSSSNAAALGGGIGGGVGGALLLIAALLFFFFWHRKNKKNKTAQATTAFTPVSQNPNGSYAGSPPVQGYFPGGVVASGGSSGYKYDPQHPPAPSELGSEGQGGAYGYYDGREYKPANQQNSNPRLAELGG